MKILRVIIAFLLFVTLIFFSIGIIWPTFTYQSEVIVEAPADHCWKVFTDPDLIPEWIEGFKSIETVHSEPDEIGSKYDMIVVGNGEEMHLLETVTHYDENKLYGMQVKSEVLNNEVLIYFETDGKNTIIRAENTVSGNGLVWKSLLFLMKSTFRSTTYKQYGKLKKVIESRK